MTDDERLTPVRAQALTSRAKAAFLARLGLASAMALAAAAIPVAAAVRLPQQLPAALCAGVGLLWFAVAVASVATAVWSYRRQIHAAATSDDPRERERALQLAQVRERFLGRTPTGVDVAGLPETRLVRFLHGFGPPVLCVVALALIVAAGVLVG